MHGCQNINERICTRTKAGQLRDNLHDDAHGEGGLSTRACAHARQDINSPFPRKSGLATAPYPGPPRRSGRLTGLWPINCNIAACTHYDTARTAPHHFLAPLLPATYFSQSSCIVQQRIFPSTPRRHHDSASPTLAMAVAGLLLRLNSTFIRALEFLAAALCLGIFSYFLADLSRHHLSIPTYAKAVEGIAGAAVIYTAFAVILTCFLGGIMFLAFLAIVLDLLFMGGFIAIAVLTRRSDRCHSGTVRSVMGSGAPGTHVVGVGNLGRACKLEEAVFGAAIGAA